MGKKKLIFGETRMNRLSSRYSFVIINYSSVRKQFAYKVAHLICVTPSVKKRKKNDCAITVIKHQLKFDVGVQFISDEMKRWGTMRNTCIFSPNYTGHDYKSRDVVSIRI